MRLITILFFILTCSSCFAGFPWADNFEGSEANWTTSRPFSEMLTTEYNVTVESNSSRSLELASTNNSATTAHRIAGYTANNVTTAIVSFWFYDDGSTHESFRLGVQDITTTQASQLYIKASDTQATGNPNAYTVLSDENPLIASVPRSKGWHLTEFATDSNGTKLYLDGAELTPFYISRLKSPDEVILVGEIISTANTTASVFVDNVRFRPSNVYVGDSIVNQPLDSQLDGPWYDDLESTLSQAWDTGFFSPTGYQSDQYDHTNEAGSSYSLVLSHNNAPISEIKRICELPYEVQTTGTLSFWFYDDGQTTNAFLLGAEVANFSAGEGRLRGATFAVGAFDGPDVLLGEYVLAKDADTTPTGIARSTGWHRVEIGADHLGTTVRLDNQDVPGNFFPGYTKITRAHFRSFYAGDTEASVWVDDVRYERVPLTSDVKDWSVY